MTGWELGFYAVLCVVIYVASLVGAWARGFRSGAKYSHDVWSKTTHHVGNAMRGGRHIDIP